MSMKISDPASNVGPISKISTEGSLPEFVVVTGKNGSGKSQLLRGIASGDIPVEIEGTRVSTSDICVLDYASIPKPSGKFPDIWENEIQMFWSVFTKAHTKGIEWVVSQLQSEPKLMQISKEDLSPLERVTGFLTGADGDQLQVDEWLKKTQEYKLAAWQQVSKEIQRLVASAKTPIVKRVNNKQVAEPSTPEFKLKQHLLSVGVKIEQIVSNLLSQEVGDISDFDYDRLVALWPPHSIGSAYFAEPLSAWFQKYAEAFAKHIRLASFEALETDTVEVVGANEFTKKNGPAPWKIVNQVFADAGIPYTVNFPSSNSLAVFTAEMTHTLTKQSVSLDSLSSGEKAILFLLPKLAVVDEKLKVLPKLILFDEIDATLHPTLTRLLVSTIDRLTKSGTSKVILVTHSPSTVSLFGREKPNSIHLLQVSETNPCVHTLQKSSVDEAIHQLTDGLISVTSSSVFVITEAGVDARVYQDLYDWMVVKKHLNGFPNLVFLKATDEKDEAGGGNGQVRQWATKLKDAGLPNFRGLIDHDYDSNPEGVIHVLDRYAIENFLLDPILLFARLLGAHEHTRVLDGGYPAVFNENHNLSLLHEQTADELQLIANTIIAKIREVLGRDDQAIDGNAEIKYLNGKEITVPNWLLLGRGKNIHANVKAAFDSTRPESPRLFSRLEPLAEILVKNIPEFIPQSLVLQFQHLQEPDALELQKKQ